MFKKNATTTATPATTTTTATVTPATTTKKNTFKNLIPAFGAGFVGGCTAFVVIRAGKKVAHMITTKIGSSDPTPEPTTDTTANNESTPDNEGDAE